MLAMVHPSSSIQFPFAPLKVSRRAPRQRMLAGVCTYTCQSVVLRDYKVTGVYTVHQREIYAVGTFVKGQRLRAVTLDLVGGVA